MEYGPSILETRSRNSFMSSYIEHLDLRRSQTPIRPARMAKKTYAKQPSSRIAPTVSSFRRQALLSSSEKFPIEVNDTDNADNSDVTSQSESSRDNIADIESVVIEIVDDDSRPFTNMGRKSLFQTKSQSYTEDKPISSSSSPSARLENTPHQNIQMSRITSRPSRAKETLIGGANKLHLPPDDPVMVLDDVAMDPSTLGPKLKKDLAQCQGTSSLDEELEVNWLPAYPVYIALKQKLATECRQIDYIRGDGNCFFRAISKQLYGSERYHKTIRNLIVDLIATNKPHFAQFVDGEDVQDHVQCMCLDQSWATTCEIYAASTLLQRDVFMLTPDHLNETYSWLLFKPVFQCDSQGSGIDTHPCYLTLCNTNGNHYDRIVPEHGSCNCFLPHPELEGVSYSVDLTEDS